MPPKPCAELGPDDTVVAIISGNGYKTLDEHPEKPWPEMVACDVESMEATLADFRRAGAGAALPRLGEDDDRHLWRRRALSYI